MPCALHIVIRSFSLKYSWKEEHDKQVLTHITIMTLRKLLCVCEITLLYVIDGNLYSV